MTFRRSSLCGCLALVLAWCVATQCSARAADRRPGRSIEFSTPKSSSVLTNLPQSNVRSDGLRQLEEDLSPRLRSLTPSSSLDGVLPPPNPPHVSEPAMSKKNRELLDRQKYWSLMAPDDFVKTQTAEEILKLPQYGADGRPSQGLSILERYWLSQDAKYSPHGKKSGASKDDDPFNTAAKRPNGDDLGLHDSDLPEGVTKAEQALVNELRANKEQKTESETARRGIFTDVFKVDPDAFRERTPLEKARMDEFKEWLGIAPTPSPFSASGKTASPSAITDLITGSTRPEVKPVTAVAGVPPPGSVPVTGSSLASPFKPTYVGGIPATASALASSSSTTLTPPTAPVVTPPKPAFEFPRRKF